MKSLFAPAVALMDRLTYPGKFGAIGTLFALPLLLVCIFLTREWADRIDFAQRELTGNAYLRALRQLAAELQQQRDTLCAAPQIGPDRDLAAGIAIRAQEIDAVDRQLGELSRPPRSGFRFAAYCEISPRIWLGWSLRSASSGITNCWQNCSN